VVTVTRQGRDKEAINLATFTLSLVPPIIQIVIFIAIVACY
jgi:hypothetical protein